MGVRMHDTAYLTDRAQQELSAALRSPDCRVRDIHLDMADAYLVQMREAQIRARRSQVRLVDAV